jgi:hypothetical protein
MKKVVLLLVTLAMFNCESECTQEAKKVYLGGKSQSWTLCLNGQTKTYSNYNAYINVLNNNPNATDGACETLSNNGISTEEELVDVPCEFNLPSKMFTDENGNQFYYTNR